MTPPWHWSLGKATASRIRTTLRPRQPLGTAGVLVQHRRRPKDAVWCVSGSDSAAQFSGSGCLPAANLLCWSLPYDSPLPVAALRMLCTLQGRELQWRLAQCSHSTAIWRATARISLLLRVWPGVTGAAALRAGQFKTNSLEAAAGGSKLQLRESGLSGCSTC